MIPDSILSEIIMEAVRKSDTNLPQWFWYSALKIQQKDTHWTVRLQIPKVVRPIKIIKIPHPRSFQGQIIT